MQKRAPSLFSHLSEPHTPRERNMGHSHQSPFDFEAAFEQATAVLKSEQRYRTFADIERICGRFPLAIWHSPGGPREVTLWCSNDYLGMSQKAEVVLAMVGTAMRLGTGAGGTRNIAGTQHPLVELEAELASLHGKQ